MKVRMEVTWIHASEAGFRPKERVWSECWNEYGGNTLLETFVLSDLAEPQDLLDLYQRFDDLKQRFSDLVLPPIPDNLLARIPALKVRKFRTPAQEADHGRA